MFNKILVPLDGSELAERALEPALTLAPPQSELTLLRGIAPEKILIPDAHSLLIGYSVLWPDQSLEDSRKEARSYLQAVRKSKIPQDMTVRLEVAEEDAAEAILSLAAAEDIDLISMSSHGYSGLTRWVLGSVAERVLHHAPCPVLVIRSPVPFHQVLVPLDGSKLSEEALGPGLELAGRLGCEVTLLCVTPTVALREVEYLDGVEDGLGQRLAERLHAEARTYLDHLLDAHERPELALKTVITGGSPATGILKYAEEQGIDLIAMSTHGRTGLSRWVYGSVTEKVLRGARHSMLVVRPAAHRLN